RGGAYRGGARAHPAIPHRSVAGARSAAPRGIGGAGGIPGVARGAPGSSGIAMIPALRHLSTLISVRRGLVARFVVTSLGRSACTMAAILLVREFLGNLLGGEGGAAGGTGALWMVAGALFLAYFAASLFGYDNQVTQQRMVKALEMGMMERVLQHLLLQSVSFFEGQSRGDLVQAVRQDVSELRTAVFAVGR